MTPDLLRLLHVLHGGLVIRSPFLPRVLGGLSLVSGIGWLTFLRQ
ncbi:MAG: hypothetical protein ABI877_21750 [Gemmatimonadaceae bacterium]